ncbi:MAG TPA: flagellar export chaperone FliS [Gammaproteobacteria bacterium]|nr:flagellar export chaperone FliS [Gammaproteobacteria bacterium]
MEPRMEGMKTAVSAYQTVQIDAAVLGASPHELIGKLLARAMEAIAEAKEQIQTKDISGKSQNIKIATSIISDGLRSSLNMEAGGEIAANLDGLYDYMLRQLMKAHAENNTAILDEIVTLLQEIKSGWDGIKP